LLDEKEDELRMHLEDGRVVIFADEPDMAIYRGNKIQVAVEIKGGIDTAGVLERGGLALLLRVSAELRRKIRSLLQPSFSRECQ
jgi:hypothetical protein